MIDTKETLAQHVEDEVMACIGCHDCMLACPLAESQFMNVAELNAAVHLPTINNARVAQFVAACTQCQQCVPACPADLSRADMVLFNKMKLEDSVPDQQLFIQAGVHVLPSTFTLDGMSQSLTQLNLFAGVSHQDLRRMMLKVTLRRLEVGEVLCREGEFHERLYIVLEGVLEQLSSGPYGEAIRILVLAQGAFFGEMAIMADQPEPFTVMAVQPSVVIEIPKAAVHRLMNQSAAFQTTMDDLYRRRALWTYTRKPSLFGGLPEPAMEELMSRAELLPLSAGQMLVREGDAPKNVYLVRSGFLRVSRGEAPNEAVLVYFREGDVFGALPLLLGEPVQWYSVQASCRAEVVRIPGAVLKQVLAHYPHARQGLMQAQEVEQVARAQAYAAHTQPPQQTSPTATGGAAKHQTMMQVLSIEALVDAGLAQGSEVLVVDQDRCTNCRACVEACGRRHDFSRLELRGLQMDNLLFPTACRHCEDPVCLLCSVNGIMRLPSGEITIVKDNCIGCGACAERCPYGNIRMHQRDKPQRGFWSGVWSMLRGARQDDEQEELDPHMPQLAVKCDLCAGYDNYACVTACPVGAAARIDPTQVVGDHAGLIGLKVKGRD